MSGATKKYDLLWLLLTWAAMQAILFFHNGLITTGEPVKYISEAETFLQTGHFSSANFWLYSVFIFLIMAGIKLKLGYSLAVAVQLILSGLAVVSLYRFSSTVFSRVTALVGGLLFIGNYPLQEFNTYLQTESIYYSLSVIFSVYLLQIRTCTGKQLTVLALLLVLLSLTRPTGILFIPVTAAYLFVRFFSSYNRWLKLAMVALPVIIFLVSLNLALGSGGELDFILPFIRENIICGVDTVLPGQAVHPGNNSLHGLFYYIVHHPGQFARMAWLRTIAFFGLTRNYYSTGHNLFLALFFYPLYALCLISIKWWLKKEGARLLYLSGVIILNWCTVMLTCDDWHNRFLLSISAFIILLGLPAVNKVFARLSN